MFLIRIPIGNRKVICLIIIKPDSKAFNLRLTNKIAAIYYTPLPPLITLIVYLKVN